MSSYESYYVPHKATWPILATASLLIAFAGFANYLNGNPAGSSYLILGLVLFIVMLGFWFALQAAESEAGTYSEQVGVSFRMGMFWFIFSEVMFFAVFFGTLWYTRSLVVPWLGGEGFGPGRSTAMLWEGFTATWPTNGPENVGGDFEPMGAWGLPFLNTLILLTSGVTVTWAHWGLLQNNRIQLMKGLAATAILGFSFVCLQAYEYAEAYHEMGLTLGSGIYGSTFFMLTGFHGLHVTIGSIMLTVILFRSWKGHFSPDNHFAFEGVAWYWHFVDVVWLGLFVFVYLL